MKRADCVEAAAMLRRVIDATYAGDLDADSPHGRMLLHHLEGAALGFELAAGVQPSL